jgi:uncharacterized membrane protein
MHNQIIAALLRLLPTSNYQSADNPLQVDRLPKNTKPELDYPVFQDEPAVASRRTALLILLPMLAAPVLVWTGDLIAVPFITGGLSTLALLAAVGLIVAGVIGRWSGLAAFFVAAALLPMFAILVRDLPFALAALVVALIGTVCVADSLATNYIHLRTAAPVDRSLALNVRSAWRWRWLALLRPLRGAEAYLLGYIVVPIAGWCALRSIAEVNRTDFWEAFRVFLTIAAIGISVAIVHESFLPLFYARRPYSLLNRVRILADALVQWSTYNSRDTRGIGVHQSPVGNCATRRYLLIGVILAWCCLWSGLQVAQAPPLALIEQKMTRLVEAFHNLHRPKPNPEVFVPPDDSASVPPLSAEQKELISGLPPEIADGYLRQWRDVNQQEQKLKRAREEKARAIERTGNLLVKFTERMARIALDVLVPSLWTLAAVGGLVFAMVARSLAGIDSLLPSGPRERVLSSKNWERLVARVRESHDEIEKTSLFLGTNARDDTPVLVPRDVFKEHVHVLGDTGSGKTSMGLLPLVTQLMRFGDCSVVVIDLKADDQVFFECLRKEADKLTALLQKKDPDHPGYALRWFTTVLGRSSFAFNPLTQSVMPKLALDQRTDILTAALGLQYGNDYGRKFFGDSNYDVLNFVMQRNPKVESFVELEEALNSIELSSLPKEIRNAGVHVTSAVRRLSRFKVLNTCPTLKTPRAVLDNAIDLSDLFSRPQALYVALPPAAGVSTTAEIARIFLYSLLAAAQTHSRPRKQVYLVVDEFQRIISKNVELFLQQARSMNIGCIFSNQSLADLNSIDADLIPAVRANTRFRQVFGAGNQTDLEDLVSSGGETVYGSRSWNYSPGIWSWILQGFSIRENRGPRLTVNDILLATDAPGRNIACIRRGDGYAQFGGMPFVMDSVYHVSPTIYGEHEKVEWPAGDERTLVATLEDAKSSGPVLGPTILSGESESDSSVAKSDESPESNDEPMVDGRLEEMAREQEEKAKARRKKQKANRLQQQFPPEIR